MFMAKPFGKDIVQAHGVFFALVLLYPIHYSIYVYISFIRCLMDMIWIWFSLDTLEKIYKISERALDGEGIFYKIFERAGQEGIF